MDIDVLIAKVVLILQYGTSFNRLEHGNRNIVDSCWRKISREMDFDKDQVRTKWKYLKDQYRKERKKVTSCRSADEGGRTQTSLWPFFELLHFLKDEINQSGNLSQHSQLTNMGLEASKEDSNLVKEERDTEEFFNLDTDENQSPHQTSHCWGDLWPIPSSNQPPSSSANGVSLSNLQPYSRKRKQTVEESVAKKILLLEEQKLELLIADKKEEPSEDYHFLMSLLPHFKDMEPLQKLRIRNKIIQVLIDEDQSR